MRGLNVYNANSHGWCWYAMNSGLALDTALSAWGDRKNVMRAWFFQPLAQPTPDSPPMVRTWDAFDHTLEVADAHGLKVIATLTDQWGECGDGGANGYKGQDWYETGYRTVVQPGMVATYRDYVTEVVTRYKDDPRIAFWQLINEAEVSPVIDGVRQPCPAGDEPASVLKAWAAEMSDLVKSIDSNHLVSLGTIGGGQCGTQGAQYQAVHDLPNIDLCEYHDYSPTQAMPGDQWNGLQVRLDQCATLNKPLFVGEVGIRANEVGGTLADRAAALLAKLESQSGAGVQGFLAWAWNNDGVGDPVSYDIGPSDPLLDVLMVNHAPYALDDGGTARSGADTLVHPLVNDGDDDNDPLIVRSATQPMHGAVTCGRMECRYTPEPGFLGQDSFNYVAADGKGGTDQGSVTLQVMDTPASAISRLSVGPGGASSNDESYAPSVSADGRYVAFYSLASNLVAGDTNGQGDVFVHDLQMGTIELISLATQGTRGNRISARPRISADGRYVAFESYASNLVPGDTNNEPDILLRDRQAGTTERISVSSTGGQSNSFSSQASISGDGRYVAFYTGASFAPNDPGVGGSDVYLRDRQAGTTTLVSVDSTGAPAGGYDPSISGDGRYVVFTSDTRIVNDANDMRDTFVRDMTTGTTELVSADSSGMAPPNSGPNYGSHVYGGSSMSSDGRYVVFYSYSRVITGDLPGNTDVYIRDRQAGVTTRLTAPTEQPNGMSYGASVAADGSYAVFQSEANNLVSGDTNGQADIFRRRIGPSGVVERINLAYDGTQAQGSSYFPTVSNGGQVVAWHSDAANVVPGDTGFWDVFAWQDPSPPTPPDAPTNATATAGDGQATLTWTAPTSDGDSPLTGYTVTASPGGQTATVSGDLTTAIVTGVTNGTAYTFTVKATNAVGTGPASAPSNSVTPSAKANQTITFGNLANRTMLQSPFTVTATASSGLPASFSTTTPTVCTSSGTNGQTITLVGAGTCTVKADQVGNASFNPAPSVSRSFTVSRVSQSITFNALSNRTMLQTPVTVPATASSGLPVTFASTTPSVCTTSGVTGSTVDLLAPGTCTIVASQAGNATYAPAPNKTRSFTVSRAPQNITFTNPGNKTLIQSPLTVIATASSGFQVTFTTTTPAVCTSGGTAGATITFLRTGSCSVVASQPGNAVYAPAASITRTFTVGQATQTINFGPLPTANLQQSPITVTATASSGLTVTFASSSGSVCTAGGPNGATITLLRAGTCKVVASQAGNATYKAAPNVTQSFTVTTAKLAQTITFAPLADRSIGAPPLTLSATASSGLAVSYAIAPASAAICSVSGSVLTLTNTGTCTITASQAGSTIYNAATPVTQNLTATLGGFVQASGTSLVLDGQPFQVFGAAIYQTSNYGHTADPDQIFGWADDAHLNTLRLTDIFEQTTNDPNAPYREADWQWIDGLIARSQDEGLKVILDLSSYRNWLVWSAQIDHGWVTNCADTATPAERAEVDFPLLDPYTVAHRADWTQFMTFVANRVNTVSGITYRNDPTILVVSIAGEPVGAGYDICGRASSEQELTDFFAWSLAEWKSLDPHHLRSTGGLHGTYAGLDGNGDPIPSTQQVDGIAIFSLADNTLPSLHTYPPRTTQLPLADGQTPVLAPVAQDLGKPWFTEEFGFMQDDGDSFRASEFDFVFDEQTAYGSVGSLFWNLGPEIGVGTFDVNPSTPLTWARVLAEAP